MLMRKRLRSLGLGRHSAALCSSAHVTIAAAERVAALLKQRGEGVAVCETSAGGMICAALLGVSGASAFFRGGAVCYTAESKRQFLDYEPARPTVTSAHALELAVVARDKLGCEWGIGESGVAGPTNNSRGVSPGVCAVAVVGPNGFSKALMLWPEEELSAADAYGQPPKIERRMAMATFADKALELLHEALAQSGAS